MVRALAPRALSRCAVPERRRPATAKFLGTLVLACAACAACVVPPLPARAFGPTPRDAKGDYLKWGTSHLAGTSGGVVTWGFVAAGTDGSPYCALFCKGQSLDGLEHFYPAPQLDHETRPIDFDRLRPVFQAAFDAWSGVADIRFEYVGVDRSMKAVNDPRVASPMIRIGIWRFGGLLAYFSPGAAFPPRLRGSTGIGHVFINANVGYQLSDQTENARLQDFPAGGGLYMTDLYQLALHEIGHAIGLGGSDDPNAVMWQTRDPDPTLRPAFAWRGPQPDDVAAARFLYGASVSPPAPEHAVGAR